MMNNIRDLFERYMHISFQVNDYQHALHYASHEIVDSIEGPAWALELLLTNFV
jgi:hypothetical protein